MYVECESYFGNVRAKNLKHTYIKYIKKIIFLKIESKTFILRKIQYIFLKNNILSTIIASLPNTHQLPNDNNNDNFECNYFATTYI